MAIKEFHDLAELQLNINPLNSAVETSWGNLGYWSDSPGSDSYAQACTTLATKVGNMAELGTWHRVLDTGFGCGDQLQVWLGQFNIRNLTGINLSVSQTQFANEKINAMNLSQDIHCQLQTGDVCCDLAWQGLDDKFDRIIALDCIYHFEDKSRYFEQCEKHLKENGVLVVTDLLLNTSAVKIWHKLILKSICYFSHIPFKNIKTLESYQQELQALGLQLVKNEDISAKVFLPFGHWLEGYITQVNNSDANKVKFNWVKYRGTARFLRWAHDNAVFGYHILRIERLR